VGQLSLDDVAEAETELASAVEGVRYLWAWRASGCVGKEAFRLVTRRLRDMDAERCEAVISELETRDRSSRDGS
jgi:hypothetical protein